ncbi:DUF402 domain-containing protein [Paenibacillus sp. NPDC058071]|uniref:DUF402 domain-containing protein n=1 Tax=Paenibacillus sp. NPDC058071 TaxID=3346326 RepID=UPI0036DABD29
MDNQQMRIQSLKYGNHLHYEWDTTLLEKTDEHIFVLGHRGRKLKHYTKGKVFTMENWTIEFFPFDAWFTVSADIIDGKVTQYYCNICQPAKLNENTVTFVDLDIDLIYTNGRWNVVDEDEFAANAVKFSYPPDLVRRVIQEQKSLEERIEQGRFPFDGTIERLIKMLPDGE